MAIQRKQNFLGGQRVDVPHLRAIESGVAADFAELVNGFISDGLTNHIIRGFSHNAESTSVARGSWAITVANSVVMSKTDEICLFAFPSTAPVIYPFQTGSFSDGVDYYVGVTISSVTHDPQIVKFLDDVTNTEISKTVPLAVVLDYVVQPTATAVTSDPNTIWIYRVQSVGGLITAANVTYPTGTRYPFMVGTTKYTNLLDWIQAVYIAGINGPAGGVLGYNGSSQYPNPNGLAPLDGVIGPLDTVPIKAGTSLVSFAVDARTTNSAAGSGLTLTAGAGGPSAAGVAGGSGGTARLQAPAGIAGNTGASNGGSGGFVILTAGAGGSTTSGTGTPGSGGGITFQPGVGGAGNTTNGGASAGNVAFNGAVGGAGASGVTAGGEGSRFNVVTGNGGAGGGDSGYVAIQSGTGGAGDSLYSGGAAGFIGLAGGTGGAGTASTAPGLGGPVTLQGGNSGANNGTANTASSGSGYVYIGSGNGAAGGNSGWVQITTAPIAVVGANPTLSAAPVGLNGGNFLVKNQDGGDGDVTYTPGVGGSSLFLCGDGGDTSTSSSTGGVGGGFSVTTGAGGSGAAGYAGGDGGGILLQASAGGPSGGNTAGDGGTIALVTGTGGSAGAGIGGQGGSILIGCGLSTGNRNGAQFLATAGRAGGSGTGGPLILLGGSTDTGVGGVAGISGGNAVVAGTGGGVSVQGGNGSVADGGVFIGTSHGAKVDIGIVDRNVTTIGRDVGHVVSYSPVAGTTIPVTSPVIQFTNTTSQAMSGTTPQIQTTGIAAGTRLTLIGGANAVTFDRDSHVAGSGLRLTANSLVVNQYDILELMFSGTEWYQISFSQNS